MFFGTLVRGFRTSLEQNLRERIPMSLYTISAFADEIGPDPEHQMAILGRSGVHRIEFRSIHSTNVLDLTDLQISEFQSLLKKHSFGLSAIGSPIGKVRIDSPFEPHLKRFERAIELAKRLETPNIRIFSYYLPEAGRDWTTWRSEVMARLETKVRLAEKAGLILLHENEHNIYGDSPERVEDIFRQISSPHFKAAYDAANFVFCGYCPIEGWNRTKAHTVHLHIKDWIHGEKHGCLAGRGQGQWQKVIDEATQTGYKGFATMEPHFRGGGPTGGYTGPDLFPLAIDAFRTILDRAGAAWN